MSEDAQQLAEVKNNEVNKAEGAPAREKKSVAQHVIVTLGANIEIYAASRIPEYDIGPIKAYQAMEKDGRLEKCFALVCEPHLVPRLRSASVYSAIINASLVTLASYGVVYWPPDKQERCVFVYRDTLGKRALAENGKQAMGWRQELVMASVVTPLVGVLADMRNKDFVHGAIRPSNMFLRGSGNNIERAVLGDCLSMPSSYSQPALYEPIERAMASPIARGLGTPSDDMYSLGASLAVFLRMNDPCEGMSDEEVIKHKIEFGSYSTLTGKDRFKGSVLELLRGLLHDDAAQRWTIEEVMTWLDGRRLSPKQSIPQKKAQRHITFMSERYFLMSLLALELPKSTGEALKLVESGELEQWIVRSVDDDEATQRVEEAKKTVWDDGKGAGYEDKLVANLSQVLDPSAPVRYKGMALLADGVGSALAEAVFMKRDTKPFFDLFLHGIVLNWITGQKKLNIDTGSMISRFDSCRSYVRQTRIGFGIERCLYALCPEAQCLSDKLKDYFVRGPEDLLVAFEDLCQKGKSPAYFLDRHIAAFLSVKDSKCVDSFLYDLDAPEDYKKILANLKSLASIQKRSTIKSLPHTAKAFQDMMDAVYLRYHDREVREKIRKSIDKYVSEGSLVKMAGLLESTEVAGKDMEAFKAAMREYRLLTDEAKRLDLRLQDRDLFGKSTGKEVAAVVSGIIASVVIIFVSIAFLSK